MHKNLKKQFKGGIRRIRNQLQEQSSSSASTQFWNPARQLRFQQNYTSKKQQLRKMLIQPFHLDKNYRATIHEAYQYQYRYGYQDPNDQPKKFRTQQINQQRPDYKGRQKQIERNNRAYQRQLMIYQNNSVNLNNFRLQPRFVSENRGRQYRLPLYDYDQYSTGNFQFPNKFIRYKIIPIKKLKMALDVATIDSKDLEKGGLIVFDYHGGSNQHFFLKKTSNNPNQNSYYIINASTGFSLQVPQLKKQGNCQVVSGPHERKFNQVWVLIPVDQKNRQYKISSPYANNKILDVQNTFMRNGNPVIVYGDSDGSNQKWKIWPS